MATLDRSLLANVPIFDAYGPRQLDDILASARAIRRPRGAILFEQGEEAVSFFLVLHGRLRAAKLTPAGQQVVVRHVGPREFCGLAVAIGKTTYPATTQAVADSVMLAWPSSIWPDLSRKYPSLVEAMLQVVGERLLDAHSRVVEMATEAVERRVAHALLRLAQQAGKPVKQGVEIDFPISRQDVAEMAGTTLHTVSRVFSAWESRGLIEAGRQRVVIRDPHGLYALAEGAASTQAPSR